jgi:hypothetical protein
VSYFREMLEGAGFEVSSYSGRGMYGRQCPSVTASSWQEFVSLLLQATEDVDTDLISLCHTDSMGYDTVFYWPSEDWIDA